MAYTFSYIKRLIYTHIFGWHWSCRGPYWHYRFSGATSYLWQNKWTLRQVRWPRLTNHRCWSIVIWSQQRDVKLPWSDLIRLLHYTHCQIPTTNPFCLSTFMDRGLFISLFVVFRCALQRCLIGCLMILWWYNYQS